MTTAETIDYGLAMNKARGGVALLVVHSLLLAACGKVGNDDADAGPDAQAPAGDAAVDALPAGVKFDVGYVDDLTVTPDITDVFGFLVVVNTGTKPLDLATASVVNFLDDSSAVAWTFTKEVGSTAILAPGRAGGFLSLAAKAKVLSTGVVTEQLDDEVLTFSMNFTPRLAAGTTVSAHAVLEIDQVQVIVPFTITAATGTDVEFNSATRLTAR